MTRGDLHLAGAGASSAAGSPSPAMRQPPPSSTEPAARRSAAEEADAREFAEFIAGQDPLDAAAADWLVRRQDGLTPEEEAELQAWLAADPAHADALEQLEDVWGRMDDVPDADLAALRTGLARDAAPAATPALPSPPPFPAQPQPTFPAARPAPTTPSRRAWLLDLGRLLPQAALASLAVGTLGGGWYGWNAWRRQASFVQALATQRGQHKQVRLPDGSTLWLDTATQADVALYRHRREFRLNEGQVFFAVQSLPGQPFEVLAGGTRVTVVGTRFAVRYTRQGLGEAGGVHVAVEEGRVRVAPADAPAGTQAVALVAGECVQTDAAGVPGAVGRSAGTAAAWREGRLNFDNTPLAQALAEFERYADTGLVLRDPAVAALRVHGSFDLRQADAFARALPQVLPVRLRRVDGRLEIVRASAS